MRFWVYEDKKERIRRSFTKRHAPIATTVRAGDRGAFQVRASGIDRYASREGAFQKAQARATGRKEFRGCGIVGVSCVRDFPWTGCSRRLIVGVGGAT